MNLIYLASPYTPLGARTEGEASQLREARFKDVCRAAATLMAAGHVVFCPIAHSHPIEEEMAARGDGEFWKRQDAPYLEVCTSMVVLTIDGWQQSNGVRHEITRATERGIPILYMDPV